MKNELKNMERNDRPFFAKATERLLTYFAGAMFGQWMGGTGLEDAVSSSAATALICLPLLWKFQNRFDGESK